MGEPIKTTTSLLCPQCPRCGTAVCKYEDDLERDLEQYRCSVCGQVFNVRWEREIQCIGWEGEDGQFHEVWNSDLIVGTQVQAVYDFCYYLWKRYGGQQPQWIDPAKWDLLCAAMQSIEDALPKADHEFVEGQS